MTTTTQATANWYDLLHDYAAIHRGQVCRIIDAGTDAGYRWLRLDPRDRPCYRVWVNEVEIVRVNP